MATPQNLESIMAQLQEIQSVVYQMAAGGSGLDFSGMMGNDDNEMPNVPIGGGIENFDLKKNGESKVIGNGVVCIGRQHYIVNGCKLSGDGQYRLKVDLSSMEVTVEAGDGFEGPDDEVSYIPLYEVKDNEIVKDYRSNFCVVARE